LLWLSELTSMKLRHSSFVDASSDTTRSATYRIDDHNMWISQYNLMTSDSALEVVKDIRSIKSKTCKLLM
jgi:hypothetical protein